MSEFNASANLGLFRRFSLRRGVSDLLRRRKPRADAAARRPILHGRASDYALIYAIGDVHGCLSELRQAMDRIVADAAGTPGPKLLVLLGDYVDRGPHSCGVIDLLLSPPPEDFTRIALCGNHDADFLRFCRQPLANIPWLAMGGSQTLLSYGIDADHYLQRFGRQAFERAVAEAVPPEHLTFLENLPVALSIDHLFFVHAGIRPGVALDRQSERDMMWIREPFLSAGPLLPITVIHGHSPTLEPVLQPQRIGLDTAAYATGRLTVARFSSDYIRII